MEHNIGRIAKLLESSDKFSTGNIHYFREIDSTNSWLLDQARSYGEIDGKICLAETQKSGKGRRGKSWIATDSSSILMSIGWKLNSPDAQGLSLVSGLAVVRSLEEMGIDEAQLKWPNDVMARGKKLGGILVEISATDCVIGVGLNVNIPPSFDMKVDQPWTDLKSLGYQVDRDQLAAAIALNHERLLSHFMLNGFAPFVEDWNSLHLSRNQVVDIIFRGGTRSGTALGVDAHGALLVESDGTVQRIISGEISIRNRANRQD